MEKASLHRADSYRVRASIASVEREFSYKLEDNNDNYKYIKIG